MCSLTTIVPFFDISKPSTVDGMSGLGLTPTLTMTKSTGSVTVWPSIATGLRRPDSSGSPKVITCNTASATRPCSEA